jgi:hypothetical protein
MGDPFLTPLLPQPDGQTDGHLARLRRALKADPALAGRASCDQSGSVVLTGPHGGRPPKSLKERERWMLHVRLRLATELGAAAATRVQVHWAELAQET